MSKVNKRIAKIALALLVLAQILAKALVYHAPATPSGPPATYHIEASYEASKGGKVVFDKH